MGTDIHWWKDPTKLAAIDATGSVAADLIERLTPEVDEDGRLAEELKELMTPVTGLMEGTLSRLSLIAERLAEAGDTARAFQLDSVVDAMRAPGQLQAYLPRLDELVRASDGLPIIGPGARQLNWARQLVGWIGDHLRSDPIPVGEDGTPQAPTSISAVIYRWGPLFLGPSDNRATVWERRYATAVLAPQTVRGCRSYASELGCPSDGDAW